MAPTLCRSRVQRLAHLIKAQSINPADVFLMRKTGAIPWEVEIFEQRAQDRFRITDKFLVAHRDQPASQNTLPVRHQPLVAAVVLAQIGKTIGEIDAWREDLKKV